MSDSPHQDPVIRITAEDAASPHVDDLLKRQASLRGETGIQADRRRRWYYSNWFIFSLAGMLGAFAAWASLEWALDDLLYVRGTVREINTLEAALRGELQARGVIDAEMDEVGEIPGGMIMLDDQEVIIMPGARPLGATDRDAAFDLATLSVGDEVGVYVQCAPSFDDPDEMLAFAVFVDVNPPPAPNNAGSLADDYRWNEMASMLLFPLVAALIGLLIGSADAMVCRQWGRLLLGGGVGLVVGFIGGFVLSALANVVYAPIAMAAQSQQGEGVGNMSTLGFLTQLGGRGLAWGLVGLSMGLGQGMSRWSGRLMIYGLLGGAIGGLLGGLLFDPIHFFLVGEGEPSGHLSRLVGLLVIGAGVGLMIGIVELLARDAWLNMVEGPLAGKEFLIFKDMMHLGASPRSDIYLFNDDEVADRHAVIQASGDNYEIQSLAEFHPVLVDGQPVTTRQRLRHGSQITLGKTVFVFHQRRTS